MMWQFFTLLSALVRGIISWAIVLFCGYFVVMFIATLLGGGWQAH